MLINLTQAWAHARALGRGAHACACTHTCSPGYSSTLDSVQAGLELSAMFLP